MCEGVGATGTLACTGFRLAIQTGQPQGLRGPEDNIRPFALPLLTILALLPYTGFAATVSYIGQLDPNNPNDILLTPFTLSSASDLVVQSYGYGGTADAPGGTNASGVIIAPGGFDSYFSLFAGSGSSATFVASNDDGGCGPATPDPVCEDARLVLDDLAAGSYVLALTLPDNYSFAENYGSGTLGDGFIGLQSDYYDYASGTERTSNYAFDLTTTPTGSGTTPAASTPEPGSLILLGSGLATLACEQYRRRRCTC